MAQPLVFISYSHKDETEKEALLSHLGMLQEAGLLRIWSDDQIKPGSDIEQAIQQSLGDATIAILLVSANYLNSPEILDSQLPAIRQRHQSGELMVMPVIIRACAWKRIDWVAKLSVRPLHEQPVWRESGRHVDEELAQIADEVAVIAQNENAQVKFSKAELPSPGQRFALATRYHSCFLCYSSSDQEFADKLYADLTAHGVNCWSAVKDMKIGARIRPTIYRSIQTQEKLLLVLSKPAINSYWVESEVEAAFEEERRRNDIILFPVMIDKSINTTKEAWATDIRRLRYIGDFTCWRDRAAYHQAFERLLRDLKAEG